MKRSVRFVVPLALVATVMSARSETVRWSFDDLPTGRAPAGFSFARTGGGAMGRWEIIAPGDSGGGKVLAQLDPDPTSSRFPLAIVDAPTAKDVKVSIRCRPMSGQVDQACGLVARYRDADDYYLVRANALEQNVRLYVVEAGRRRQLATWDGAVAGNAWTALALDVLGDRLVAWWGSDRILEARDTTFDGPGRVGLWTKADSVTWFDDLVVTPVE